MFRYGVNIKDAEPYKKEKEKGELKKEPASEQTPEDVVQIFADIHERLKIFRSEWEQESKSERNENEIAKQIADKEENRAWTQVGDWDTSFFMCQTRTDEKPCLVQNEWKGYKNTNENGDFDKGRKSLDRREEVGRMELCSLYEYVEQWFGEQKADHRADTNAREWIEDSLP